MRKMIWNKFKVQDLLHTYFADIVKFERPIKETSNYIWGKEAHIPTLSLDPDSLYDTYELETWTVEVPFVEDIFEFVPVCREKLKKFIENKISEEEPDSSKWNQYTCHQLCDWRFLEDESGVMLNSNNCIIFVKYGVIVKDEIIN